jgi:hypothetical protein
MHYCSLLLLGCHLDVDMTMLFHLLKELNQFLFVLTDLPRSSKLRLKVAELLEHGVIHYSNSPFCSHVILVKKSDFTWRLVIDYHFLNAMTKNGKYPLPVIDELLDELFGASWFTKLDL